MARSHLNPPWVPTVLGPPAALGSGDSFTDRSPPGVARSHLNPPRVHTVLGPTAAFESGSSFTDRSPP
eukprot:9014166-Pyramimonas_sp.AAC.1